MTKRFDIKTRMSIEKLQRRVKEFNDTFVGKLVYHKKSGELYRIVGFSPLSQNGGAEYAVMYCPVSSVDGSLNTGIPHTRPASEFFDGRFIF